MGRPIDFCRESQMLFASVPPRQTRRKGTSLGGSFQWLWCATLARSAKTSESGGTKGPVSTFETKRSAVSTCENVGTRTKRFAPLVKSARADGDARSMSRQSTFTP